MYKDPEAGMSRPGLHGRGKLCTTHLCRHVPPREWWQLPTHVFVQTALH